MSLPAPNLDDLRFQSDLVDEARKRIIQYCPEWTDYNLSDPGITLIELFAWMTELMVYRLNRVPDVNYIKFLEMLGLNLMPASSAHTNLTFWLSATLPLSPGDEQTVIVPEGFEVRSELTDEDVIFTTNRELEIYPPLLSQLRKEEEFNKNHFPRLGLETFYPFNTKNPQPGDTFYLGFDTNNNISGHSLRLYFDCEPTEAVGIRRDDPPWKWEYMTKEGEWNRIELSTLEDEKDTTGGLNNEEGNLVLYLPLDFEPSNLYGLNAFWVRCRIHQQNPLQGNYSESPRVKNIRIFTMGATVPAMHSVSLEEEPLGVSKGEPGQEFELQNSPVLELEPNEALEVEEVRNGLEVFVPWKGVVDYSKSTQHDRHFKIDLATGAISFGPSVRQPDGTVVQYGRIPESGRPIRFSRYRSGGGVVGNLPVGSLTTMSMALAYISRVSNLERAVGGRDQETLEELKLRAQRELQAQRRAVTPQDYEQFTKNFSRKIARTRCVTPNDSKSVSSGTVSVLVVPSVADSLSVGNNGALHMEDKLKTDIQTYLDKYRLLTTSLNIREPRYWGIKVKTKIVPQDFTNAAEVARKVDEELQRFLTPLHLGGDKPRLVFDDNWEGWPFGRDLFTAEVVSLIQQIPSVKYVLDVEVYTRLVNPVEENSIFDDGEPEEVDLVERVLKLPDDGLICSLVHEIETSDFENMYKEE